jgi:hypothetical protein
MSKKRLSAPSIATILAIVCLVVLIAFSGVLYVFIQQNSILREKDKQIAALQNQGTPKLVNVGLQYTDDRSNANAPFLHITGQVVNNGDVKANNCTIHVNAIQGENATALDTSAVIPSLDAGATETIDLQFPYAGQALVAYSSYLEWTN